MKKYLVVLAAALAVTGCASSSSFAFLHGPNGCIKSEIRNSAGLCDSGGVSSYYTPSPTTSAK
jgi:hypothetical protein